MKKIWLYSEDLDTAEEMITAARSIAQAGDDIGVITTSKANAEELAKRDVVKVVVLDGDGDGWVEGYAAAIAAALEEVAADVVLIGNTISGRNIAPVIAAKIGGGLLSAASNIQLKDDEVEAERTVYCGVAVSHEQTGLPAVITIDKNIFDPAADEEAKTEISIKQVNRESRVACIATIKVEHQDIDISKAERVIGVGRGIDKKEDLLMIDKLADRLQAAIGCTRPIAEDEKWYSVERYIGISGQIIKGSLYIAVGISGQIQHVAGVRDVKTIVAINKDENAPVFDVADYGIVGDYNEVIPALLTAIEK
jgi:electron transfer flavoprotein alpha subunit